MRHRRIVVFLVRLWRVIGRIFWVVVNLGAVIAFGGDGIGAVFVGLVLVTGPVTRDGETWYGDTSDRFSGLAAIVMGSFALYAAFQWARWLVEAYRGGASRPEPDAGTDTGEPAGSAHADERSNWTDHDPSMAYLEDRQCTKGRVP